ncbi:hypothetical protein A2U01_0026662, partial [Trifolium medium]|nr:hypothetical protein [Trifolium medium]
QALPFFKYFAFGISLELENVLSIGSSRVCKVFLPRLAHHRRSLSLHCYGTLCSSSDMNTIVSNNFPFAYRPFFTSPFTLPLYSFHLSSKLASSLTQLYIALAQPFPLLSSPILYAGLYMQLLYWMGV